MAMRICHFDFGHRVCVTMEFIHLRHAAELLSSKRPHPSVRQIAAAELLLKRWVKKRRRYNSLPRGRS